MGCDIHAYVEYRDRKRDDKYWYNFGRRFNPGRNYVLFGLLAGVRGGEPIFAPRGLPSNLGWSAQEDSCLFISETEGERYVTLEQAQLWAVDVGVKIINDNNGKPTWVEHPDWHTHSWLTLEEFKLVLGRLSHKQVEYEALLSAMEKLAEFDKEVRIVFWFDN